MKIMSLIKQKKNYVFSITYSQNGINYNKAIKITSKPL